MARFNPIQCVFCLMLWSVSFASDTDRGCHRVQLEFVHRRVGPANLVPVNPVHDEGLSICRIRSKNTDRKSCCTRETELKYVIAAEKYLKNSIQTKNAYLKKLVMDHIAQYEEQIISLIHMSRNTTESLLTDVYNIPRSEHQHAVHEFFREIEKYIKQKHVSLYGSVSTFFNQIFPAVFKNILNDGSSVVLSEEHKECLRSKRPDISPAPFGYIPYNISHSLNEALSIAKSYMEVLYLIVEAINTTDHLAISQKCKEQTTQLQFCSHCDGHVEVKPCKGFCLNVMRRCLSQLSTLTEEWQPLLQSVVRLEAGSRAYDIEHVLNIIDKRIDNAMMYAMDSSHKYLKSVQSLCNYPVTVRNGERSSGQGHHTSLMSRSQHKLPLNKRSIPDFGDYKDPVLEIMRELLSSTKMFDMISNDICEQEIFYSQNGNSRTCWNGTTIGQYTPLVEGLSTYVSAQNLDSDPKIGILKEKLKQMKANLITRYADQGEKMFSDMGPMVHYGSGDSGSLEYVTDDEDFYGSGGSGDDEGYKVEGSGTDTNTNSQPPVIKPHFPHSTSRPENRGKPNDGKNGNAAGHVSATIVTLLITLVTSFIL